MALLETLTEDFNGTTLDAAKWVNNSSSGGTIAVGSGVLTCTTGGASGKPGILTSGEQSLTIADGSTLCVKASRASSTTGFTVVVKDLASPAYSHFITMGGDTYIYARAVDQGGANRTYTGFATYSPTTHAWLRLRFGVSGNNVTTYFETSPDGLTWTGGVTSPAATWTSLTCSVGLSANGDGDATSRAVTFDRVNLPPPPMSSLQDDFTAATLDTTKWAFSTTGSITCDTTGGTLNLTTPAGRLDNPAGTLVSQGQFQLTDSYAYAKIVPSSSASQTLAMTVRNTGSTEFISFIKTGTSLVAQYFNGTSNVVNENFTYDPAVNTWWRFRHSGSTLYWETSTDSAAWTYRTSAGFTAAGKNFTLEFKTTWSATTTATVCKIDNVNYVPPAAPPANPDTITDPETPGGPTVTFKRTPITVRAIGPLASAVSVGNGSKYFQAPNGIVDGDTLMLVIGAMNQSTSTPPTINAGFGVQWNLPFNRGASGSQNLTVVTVVNAAASMSGTNLSVVMSNTGAVSYIGQVIVFTPCAIDTKGNSTVSVAGASTALTVPQLVSGTPDLVLSLATTAATGSTLSPPVFTATDGATILFQGNADPTAYDPGLVVASRNVPGQAAFSIAGLKASAVTAQIGLVEPFAAPVFPSGIADPETLDEPAIVFTPALVADPDSITDPETLDTPTLTQAFTVQPDNLTDPETVGAPAVTQAFTVQPDNLTDPETVDNPAVTSALPAGTIYPDGIVDPETVGTPAVIPPPKAGLIETLWDDFESPAASIVKWPTRSAGVTFTDGQAVLRATGSTLQIASASFYGFGNAANQSYFYVKVALTGGADYIEVMLRDTTGAASVSFQVQFGNLIRKSVNTAGTPASVTIGPYNPVTMAWWRIRNVSTTCYFGYSADGLTWTEHAPATLAVTFGSYTAINARFVATANADTNRVIYVDNVNSLPPYAATVIPNNITDAATLGNPTVAQPVTVEPDNLADPETLGDPAVTQALEVFPDNIHDPDTVGLPELTQALTVEPDSIEDPETLDDPAITVDGPMLVEPDSINDLEQLGAGVKAAAILYPDTIADPETLGQPDVLFVRETDNWKYGAGIYSHGPYYGYLVPVAGCKPNIKYGSGTYGCGPYYGYSIPTIDDPPLFGDVADYGPPLHILGIGPWSAAINWRGAPNYGIKPGPLPPATQTTNTPAVQALTDNSITSVGNTSRPVLALPPTTSKGFTLRLEGGSEARTDHNLQRGQAVIIDEMDTDLWWRRKDPRTKKLEVIGRFNSNNVAMATSDTGVNLSAHWEDYATILGNRLILEYLEPKALPNPTTMWDTGTLVTKILAWALPDNTGLDLSEVTSANPYPLGGISQPYHLAPGTLISDVFDNLEALSVQNWEWWIETPADVNAPPKLRFIVGERGADKGVTLFDAGSGPTPIASWTRSGATDDYANTLYYTGSGTGEGDEAGGGVVETIDAEVAQYGQRDAQEGSATMGGDIDQIRAGAVKKLNMLSDRRPGYTIILTQGFWRGRSHIDIGDTIRLVLRLGKEVLNEKYRVTEIDVAIDENGYEAVTLTLGKPQASADPRSRRSPILRLVRAIKNYQIPDKALDVPEDNN